MIDPAFADKIVKRISAVEAKMSAAAADAKRPAFTELVREHARMKRILNRVHAYLKVKGDRDEYAAVLADSSADAELRAMAQAELPAMEARLPLAEKEVLIALLPPDPNEARNTIMEIRAGTGGEEAALFAGDLYRMYARFAERQGWKVELLDASPSEIGGYKEVVFSVQGDRVYRTLQFEAGTHRVQRVPVTEAQGRIHTSAATVAVLPEAEEMDDIEIKPEDLRVDLYRASGAGGQHVNKTDSAVRLTHLPTGIVVQSQDERSQHRNREKAMRVLRSRLLAQRQAQENERLGDARRAQIGSGDRSGRIRTYNFPQNRLTDHRINLTLYSLERIMNGELDELFNALDARHVATRMEKENILLDGI